jgi:hypothetical protein
MLSRIPLGECIGLVPFVVLPVVVGLMAAASDAPRSCRELAAAQRRCQFDGCDVLLIERLRRQCASDGGQK